MPPGLPALQRQPPRSSRHRRARQYSCSSPQPGERWARQPLETRHLLLLLFLPAEVPIWHRPQFPFGLRFQRFSPGWGSHRGPCPRRAAEPPPARGNAERSALTHRGHGSAPAPRHRTPAPGLAQRDDSPGRAAPRLRNGRAATRRAPRAEPQPSCPPPSPPGQPRAQVRGRAASPAGGASRAAHKAAAELLTYVRSGGLPSSAP